jgi:dihydroneopterin aldolase/2-amino-4-hydroxy-6-hydroxymethyldihydropteridine diphosphokinase/dihydropteroate synthase/2-amino-4-hydroxy-6-hydroxymethyldihydropteridine diphosphokinase/dihydropteroate synthase
MGKIVHQKSPLHGFPLLAGPSKKGFIGSATFKSDPKQRVYGTTAAVTSCIISGAQMVRVHDVSEMIDVVRVADKCITNKD